MARIALVNPPLCSVHEAFSHVLSSQAIPLGLCHLAASLRTRQHDVNIVDCQALGLDADAALDRILSFGSPYVGFTADSLTIQSAARLAGMCKEKGLKTILGGVHVTAQPSKTMLDYPEFDLAIMGEGEQRLPQLLQVLERKHPILTVPGTIYRDNDTVHEVSRGAFVRNLDELPLPAWDLLPAISKHYQPPARHEIPRPCTILATSRGCPLPCVSCNKSVFGKQRRFLSTRHIITMIRHLIQEHGIRHIIFADDTLVANKHYIEQLCKSLRNSNLGITWSCQVKADLLHSDLPSLMKESGCCRVTMPHLSGSQKVLDALNTKMQVDDIVNSFEALSAAGIKVVGDFQVGAFEESESTIQESVELIRQLRFDEIQVSLFHPLPGCEAYETASLFGRFEQSAGNGSSHFVPHGLALKQLFQAREALWRAHHLKPSVLFSSLTRRARWGDFARAVRVLAFRR